MTLNYREKFKVQDKEILGMAEIIYDDCDEMIEYEQLEKAMEVKGWGIDHESLGCATCEVANKEEYKRFEKDYKEALGIDDKIEEEFIKEGFTRTTLTIDKAYEYVIKNELKDLIVEDPEVFGSVVDILFTQDKPLEYLYQKYQDQDSFQIRSMLRYFIESI